jgi:hypothetical protein
MRKLVTVGYPIATTAADALAELASLRSRNPGRMPTNGRLSWRTHDLEPSTPPSDDVISQLKPLVDLKATGPLTDEEFASAKAKLLNS